MNNVRTVIASPKGMATITDLPIQRPSLLFILAVQYLGRINLRKGAWAGDVPVWSIPANAIICILRPINRKAYRHDSGIDLSGNSWFGSLIQISSHPSSNDL
ncbi:hypothetical protein MES5069_360118 [Mesorhizobium escarrei]|uniref:Uncharacterized protein n=1 Tax=Mesorhizobium escarrei TaxID=666018 RepID=A0ABM9E345_9HYPH|nr:hypothetical protein MES5069_360118 [Mesorhizobium escarrei]